MSTTHPCSRSRSHSLDNLRTSLTALVILHHAALPYGGLGSWLYTSRSHSPGSFLPILSFVVINQTFFMATFFLLSAYFSSLAAGKRSRRAFLCEKAKRLGVPTLVYSLVSKGVIRGVVEWRMGREGWGAVWREGVEGVRGVRGVGGPVWYCALLLVFDAVYALLFPEHFAGTTRERLRGEKLEVKKEDVPKPFRSIDVLVAISLTAFMSFWIRTEYPVGRDFKPLCLQLAFTSQYILYYIAGVYIHRSHRTLQDAISRQTLYYVAALVVVSTAFGLLLVITAVTSGTPFDSIVGQAIGGFNVFACVYAFWNECMGLLISSILLKLFTRYAVLGRKWFILGMDVGKYSYAAFLVHTPLVVDMQYLFGKSGFEEKGAVVTAVAVGILGVLESWSVGWALKEVVDQVFGRGYV
ncbi:Nn.00g031990.m01.CDS01 [Neocucurbitaria sp. VM-36]